MRQWPWLMLIALVCGILVVAMRLPVLTRSHILAAPKPVPGEDREIAWLQNPTSFENWDNFVWGVKRAEMAEDGGPSGLEVDDSAAFPTRTTAVPEIVLRRKGHAGGLRIRWYKVTDDASQEAWVNALAARNPPPLAILGGWSSDRAKELAEAMRAKAWPGSRPLLFLITATADQVDSDSDNASGGQLPNLISIYDQTFRFCFTNRQIADAVTNFVLSDPTLRPGPVLWPGLLVVPATASGPWAGLCDIAAIKSAALPRIPAYSLEWRDDPYSTDLSLKFREAFLRDTGEGSGFTPLKMEVDPIPFSTGRMNRPNAVEAAVAEHILANLPPPGTRSVLVLPSVIAPTRRVLRTLVQGNPAVGRRLVAVTGDGLGVNTFFRDRDFSWPVRSLPIPVVTFTHADPFAWDAPGNTPAPPPGYELEPPAPGGVKSSTEDIQLFTRFAQVVAAGAFPADTTSIVDSPGSLSRNLHALNPAFFEESGNRLIGSGETVVVLRPVFPGEAPEQSPHLDALLQVYVHRSDSTGWQLKHTRMLGRSPVGQE